MIVNVRLYSPKHPKGVVFTTQSDVDNALVLGFVHNKDELIAKPVPEQPKVKTCACGCGTPVTGKWVKGHSLRRKSNGG